MPSATNIFQWQARPTALPLATIGQTPVFAGPDATLTGLRATNFNPREIVFLPPETRAFAAEQASPPPPAADSARIVSQKFSAERIDFEVATTAPTMLVVAQSFYSGWRATIDFPPPTSPNFQYHDQLRSAETFRLGGGVSYAVTGSIDLGVSGFFTRWAKSDTNMSGVSLSVSYGFSPSQMIKRKKGSPAKP